MRTLLGGVMLLGCGVAALGCGDRPAPTAPAALAAAPGPVVLHLESPNTDDGALLIRISGAPVDSIAGPGLELFHAEIAPGVERVLVAGDIRSGPLLTVWLAGGGPRPGAEARVEQASARDTYEQRTISSYRLSFKPE